MGRKKKPFIDKKKGTTYHLVPRSRADPLLDDPHEPQHVLKPEQPSVVQSREEQLAQQSYYGVHYTDEYDYLQHLKEPGTAVLEPVPTATSPHEATPPAGLPGSVFGSEVKIEGKLNKVLPLTGPQPDWDPDIVASLDDPDSNFDTDDQLDDDFVLQANGGEPGVPVYVTDSKRGEGGGGEEGDVWWMERGDFTVPQQWNDQRSESTETAGSECTKTDQSEASSTKAVGGEVGSKVKMSNWSPPEERVATFTNYSVSSSVVPRNKGLTQLDQRFEKFMTEYEDSELGAPEVEEREGEGGDQWLLDLAVRDFHKNFTEKLNLVAEEEGTSVGSEKKEGGREVEEVKSEVEKRKKEGHSSCDSSEEEEGEREVEEVKSGEEKRKKEGHSSCDSSEEEEEREREVVMVEVGKPEWDCESILSTYSNLYNHPTKIVEPRSRPSTSHSPIPPTSHSPIPPASHSPIPLSKKTGIPLGAIPGPLSKEKPAKQMPVTRPRHETAEERRERKKAVKEERKFRRSEKKATKLLFQSEQLKQEKVHFYQRKTTAVV